MVISYYRGCHYSTIVDSTLKLSFIAHASIGSRSIENGFGVDGILRQMSVNDVVNMSLSYQLLKFSRHSFVSQTYYWASHPVSAPCRPQLDLTWGDVAIVRLFLRSSSRNNGKFQIERFRKHETDLQCLCNKEAQNVLHMATRYYVSISSNGFHQRQDCVSCSAASLLTFSVVSIFSSQILYNGPSRSQSLTQLLIPYYPFFHLCYRHV